MFINNIWYIFLVPARCTFHRLQRDVLFLFNFSRRHCFFFIIYLQKAATLAFMNSSFLMTLTINSLQYYQNPYKILYFPQYFITFIHTYTFQFGHFSVGNPTGKVPFFIHVKFICLVEEGRKRKEKQPQKRAEISRVPWRYLG